MPDTGLFRNLAPCPLSLTAARVQETRRFLAELHLHAVEVTLLVQFRGVSDGWAIFDFQWQWHIKNAGVVLRFKLFTKKTAKKRDVVDGRDSEEGSILGDN